MKRTLALVLAGALLCGASYRLFTVPFTAAADAPAPERKNTGNVIESARDPKVRLEFKPPIEYVGAERFVLYGVADCEIHVFVEADAQRHVKRLYWVQFEAYLPEVKSSYKYESPVNVTMGGLNFVVHGWVRATDAPSRPGSDGEHVRDLLRAKGYRLAAEMMSQRLVHLPDAEKRKELMIIHSEDLAPTGYTVADLKEGGPKASEWPALSKALLERAQAGITVTR
ncbi:MAG: hypothetical protein ACREVM_11015 [Burkholderiales bacterium]